MHPILFRIGSFPIYSYTAFLDLGILLGLAIACLQGRRYGYTVVQVLDAALWGIVGGIIGGRIAYVLPNWPQYAARPAAILRLWGGGLAFHGALIGGMLGIGLYAATHYPSFWGLTDLVALGAPLGQAIGWLGALLHGSNYGQVSYEGWAWELPDLYGITVPRFPTQVVGIAIALLVFVLVRIYGRTRRFPGALFLAYLLLNSTGFFFLEFTRADKSAYWGSFRISQAAYALEALLAIGLLIYLKRLAKAKAIGESVEDKPILGG